MSSVESNLSNLGRIFGFNISTGTTTSTTTTGSTNSSVNFNDEYKTSLAELEQMYRNGTITKNEYKQLKKELQTELNYKKNVFDSNNDQCLTGYEAELYNEFISSAATGSDVNLRKKFNQDKKELQQLMQQRTITKQEYRELLQELQKEYTENQKLDTNKDGVLSAEEANIGNYKEKVALYKKMDKDGDMELNKNEQAALGAYNTAIANPDTTFEDVSISDLIKDCSSTSEKLQMIMQLKQFDLDGDGKFNYAEYQSMQGYLNPPEDESTKSEESDNTDTDADLIAKFDLDGDGILSATEQAALDAYKAQKEESDLIAKFDLDGNGVLDATEQAALDAYKAQKEESDLIAKFDLDGNSVLDASEQAALETYKTQQEEAALKAKFDLDGNGVLDASEQAALDAYKNKNKTKTTQVKSQFDLDGNGVLDASEQAAMKSYKTTEKY